MQTNSTWERNFLDLIGIGQYFDASLEVLLKEELSLEDSEEEPPTTPVPRYYPWHYEYKSKRTLFGLPLVHINMGYGLRKARRDFYSEGIAEAIGRDLWTLIIRWAKDPRTPTLYALAVFACLFLQKSTRVT